MNEVFGAMRTHQGQPQELVWSLYPTILEALVDISGRKSKAEWDMDNREPDGVSFMIVEGHQVCIVPANQLLANSLYRVSRELVKHLAVDEREKQEFLQLIDQMILADHEPPMNKAGKDRWEARLAPVHKNATSKYRHLSSLPSLIKEFLGANRNEDRTRRYLDGARYMHNLLETYSGCKELGRVIAQEEQALRKDLQGLVPVGIDIPEYELAS